MLKKPSCLINAFATGPFRGQGFYYNTDVIYNALTWDDQRNYLGGDYTASPYKPFKIPLEMEVPNET